MGSTPQSCLWCGGALAPEQPLLVREMMFGTRDAYALGRCGECGSLVLLDPPADPGVAYPPGYYALGAPARFEAPDNLKRRALRTASALLLRLPEPLADRLLLRAPFSLVPFRWFAGRGVRTSDPILDVGSGDGYLLRRLALLGFRHLVGIDPHLSAGISGPVLELRRAGLGEVDERFAVIMAHHALEHVEDPVATLTQAAERLTPGGTVVARVPLADGWALGHYGADWVQLDPPRHLSVPTEAGVRRAAAAAGLRVERAFRDSDSIQFWGSEQYRLGIPLNDPRSVMRDASAGPFTRRRLRRWRARARALNRAGAGDSGCFVLSRD